MIMHLMLLSAGVAVGPALVTRPRHSLRHFMALGVILVHAAPLHRLHTQLLESGSAVGDAKRLGIVVLSAHVKD